MQPSPRLVFGGMALAAAALILFAIYYLQDYVGLDPCPMCILSRYVFIAIAAVALFATLHGPRGIALKGYGVLVGILAVAGIGVSIRHSYLQRFPPAVESCGTDLEFLLNAFPLSQALPKIFAGSGSCSAVKWTFLGLTIPEWAGIWFVIFGAAALWAAFRRAGARA